jgi:hypothetical protein
MDHSVAKDLWRSRLRDLAQLCALGETFTRATIGRGRRPPEKGFVKCSECRERAKRYSLTNYHRRRGRKGAAA